MNYSDNYFHLPLSSPHTAVSNRRTSILSNVSLASHPPHTLLTLLMVIYEAVIAMTLPVLMMNGILASLKANKKKTIIGRVKLLVKDH